MTTVRILPVAGRLVEQTFVWLVSTDRAWCWLSIALHLLLTSPTFGRPTILDYDT